jgi:hypothetical protein
MWYFVEAIAILLSDPVPVEGFEVPERRHVKQHHYEQHLGGGKLAGAVSFLLRRDEPMGFPLFKNFAEIIETAVKRRDIYRP